MSLEDQYHEAFLDCLRTGEALLKAVKEESNQITSLRAAFMEAVRIDLEISPYYDNGFTPQQHEREARIFLSSIIYEQLERYNSREDYSQFRENPEAIDKLFPTYER